jgi:hypothetical protein
MDDVAAPLYVAADIHGHRTEFRDALVGAGLIDRGGRWCGGNARLWLLGDYVDRGPDGIGVIDDIRALTAAAADAGGQVYSLLGNHEVQLLAAHHFGTVPVEGLDEPGGFRGGWARFGGCDSDLRRLTADHIAWMSALPAVAVVGDHLLVHSDTARYLEFGSTVEAVNAVVSAALHSRDSAVWLEFSDRMSDRGAFRDDVSAGAGDAVSTMLDTLGASTIVHGHSTLTKYFGIAPENVREGLWYAGGRVLNVDGGVYEGGRILVTRLR